jgi:hypothetical protein
MADLVLDVNINPEGAASVTETNPTTTNPQAKENKKKTDKGLIESGLLFASARNIAMTTIGSIGDITGSKELQRNIQTSMNAMAIGYAAMVNPGAAALYLATEFAGAGIKQSVMVQNQRVQIAYHRKILENTYSNNRR